MDLTEKRSWLSSVASCVLSTSHQLQVTRNEKNRGITTRHTIQLLKMFFFGPSVTEVRDNTTWLSWRSSTHFIPLSHFLDGLTLHSSPRLQGGLRQNELRRRLRQDVVAKYLLRSRGRRWGYAHGIQKHWSAFLVLRPDWCGVVDVLEASRDLSRLEGVQQIRAGWCKVSSFLW